jgi:hypothetical protein
MTYPVDTILNPRAFVYASNAEALVLQSTALETKLTFLNASVDPQTLSPSYVLSSSNQDFRISKDSSLIAQFNVEKDVPQLKVPGRISTNKLEFPSNPNSKKSVVLRDFNENSLHQFAGIGYNQGETQYQVTTDSEAHTFYAGQDSLSSLELMRIQTNRRGMAQVGIGTNTINSNVMFAVSGDTSIQGNLTVQGNLNFDRTGIVQVDNVTQRISPSVLPEKMLFLNSNNQVDKAFLPQEYNFQYLKSQKNVGIGTKVPLQKFHVQGNCYFSDRIGIGTHVPKATIHAVEDFASIPTLRLENNKGGNMLEAFAQGSNIFTLSSLNSGVGIGTTLVKQGNILQVLGNGELVGRFSTSNLNVYNTITTKNFVMEENATTYITQQNLTQSDNTVQKTMMCYMPFNFTSGISTPEIRNIGSAPYVHFKSCGVRVDGDFILGSQMYVLSDARVKSDIEVIKNPLARIDRLHGYTYTLPSGQAQAGVMAQEVLDVLPEAVTLLPENYYAVSYDSIVPLLVEAVRDLNAQVKQLKSQLVS